MYKTLAEIAQHRYNVESTRRIFANEPTADMIDWLQRSGPTGWRPGAPIAGRRGAVIETLEYDDGSHLDVLPGAVYAW